MDLEGFYIPSLEDEINEYYEYEIECRLEEQENEYKQELAFNEETLGPEHPVTVSSLNSLAVFYLDRTRYDDAEPLFTRVLAFCETTLGLEDPKTAIALNNLAIFYDCQGRHVDAEPLYRRALAIRENVLHLEHLETTMRLNSLFDFFIHCTVLPENLGQILRSMKPLLQHPKIYEIESCIKVN